MPLKGNAGGIQMNYDQRLLTRLHKNWSQLPLYQRGKITYIYLCNRLALPMPMGFAYKTALLAFILLIVLPSQPSTILLAFGGALSISLFFQT